jgi:preprotein translocase subunit SecD
MKTKITLLFAAFLLLTASCSSITGYFERGGRKYNIEVKTSQPDFPNVADEAVKVLSVRLDAAGIRNKITRMNPDRIEVLAYGKFDADRVRAYLLTQGNLELAKVAGDSFQTYPTEEAAKQSMGGTVPANRRVLPYTDRADGLERNRLWIIIENPPVIDGRTVRDASAYSSTGKDDYTINFRLNGDGAEKFGDWTGRNIGKYLAIVLNDEVKSAPIIRGQIFDSGQIEGRFTKASAEDLALILKSGYLPATLTLIDESSFEN